jgi:hypothetical protein
VRPEFRRKPETVPIVDRLPLAASVRYRAISLVARRSGILNRPRLKAASHKPGSAGGVSNGFVRGRTLGGDTQGGDETIKPWLLQELIDEATER